MSDARPPAIGDSIHTREHNRKTGAFDACADFFDNEREMSMSQRSGLLRTAITSSAVLIASWLLLFACARVFSTFSGREAIQCLATATALILAVSLRVRLVAFFLAAMLAFNLSELLVHSIWSADMVRGAPVHFAVMGAGILGVVLGLAVNRYSSGRQTMAKPDAISERGI
jgi:hypothetical protein